MLGPLLDNLGIGVIVLDDGERVVGWNGWIAAASRIAAEAALGRRLDALFPELDGTRLLHAVREALGENMASVVNSVFNRSPLPLFAGRRSERMPQNIVVRPVDDPSGARLCLIQVFDLSAASQREQALENQVRLRTQAEQALRVSEARLKDAQRLARLGNWLWLPRARSFWWSEQCAATFGAAPDLAGTPTYSWSGNQGNGGTIVPNSVEDSNVDIATELAAAFDEVRWQATDIQREVRRRLGVSGSALTEEEIALLDSWLVELHDYLQAIAPQDKELTKERRRT